MERYGKMPVFCCRKGFNSYLILFMVKAITKNKNKMNYGKLGLI